MQIVVAGINHAGTLAARTLLEQHPKHEVIVLDHSDNISFLGCGIALPVAGVVRNERLVLFKSCAVNPHGRKTLLKHRSRQNWLGA